MTAELKILIVGGYGTFGGRLVELLQNDTSVTLVVAGRSLKKAQAYCYARASNVANLVPAMFDRDGNIDSQLLALQPDILVDASGPFQAYGADCYRMVEACIRQRVHYLDLADGSDFVDGIAAFDERARAANIFVLSGVSSFPVLTAAVVRRLTADMKRVKSISGGIAPSPYAGVGENVIRAIAGYAGQPVSVRRGGMNITTYALTESTQFVIAPPGFLPLKRTLFSLVDVPDLRVLAKLWPEVENIWMGAGPVPEILHRVLVAFAWLVRVRWLRSISPLARLMSFVNRHVRWGEHRGGMFVVVEGEDANHNRIHRQWHLLAEGDDGPFIPSMAVELIIRKVSAGYFPERGARAAVRELELIDYERAFANRTLYSGIRDGTAAVQPLYARLLGSAWQRLPLPIRELHDIETRSEFSGRCHIDRGKGLVSNFVARMMDFPRAGVDVPVVVNFASNKEEETWTRTFANRSFSSLQYSGHGEFEHLLCERFGPLVFVMALVASDERLTLILRAWSAFGIPLPLWCAPRSQAYESVEDGCFHFNVEINYPLVGLIVRYRGWLVRVTTHRRLDSCSQEE